MADVSLPEYVEVCPLCEGAGVARQTYTLGCGMGYFQDDGPCQICGKHSRYGKPGPGYIYKGTCEPIAPSVLVQIENMRARVPAQVKKAIEKAEGRA